MQILKMMTASANCDTAAATAPRALAPKKEVDMERPETLGQSLGRLRREAGLSPEQLAAKAGVPEFELRQLEGDSCKPHLPTLTKPVRALGASFGDLSIVVALLPHPGCGSAPCRRRPGW